MANKNRELHHYSENDGQHYMVNQMKGAGYRLAFFCGGKVMARHHIDFEYPLAPY